MNEFVESTVRNWRLCQLVTIKTTKKPITPKEPPSNPWKEVSIDLFGSVLNNKHILVVLEIFTCFPAVKIVNSTSAEPFIKALNNAYTDFGSSQTQSPDNGPPLTHKHFHNPMESAKNSPISLPLKNLLFPLPSTSKPSRSFYEPFGENHENCTLPQNTKD